MPGTQLIELTVEDGIPLRAQAIANEVANQLIRLTPAGTENVDQSRQAFIAQQLDELEASIEATREEISKKQSELASMLSARQIADAQTQITALEDKLRALQANYAALMQGTQQAATNTITIIEPATLPTAPIGPNKMAMILTAAAIGFALAAAGAYLLDYLDDTLKNPDDIQKALGLATLGAVPRIKRRHSERTAVGRFAPSLWKPTMCCARICSSPRWGIGWVRSWSPARRPTRANRLSLPI